MGEPIWAGRSEAETGEATRHEALINAAFSGVATTILCPYDRAGLDSGALEQAYRARPQIAVHGKASPWACTAQSRAVVNVSCAC